MLSTIKILGVSVTNENKDKILEYFFKRLQTAHTKTFITTPNPEMLVYASKHLDYKDKINNSTISLPDGVGLFFASSFMGNSLKERITGVDFMKDICLASKNKPLSMGFLGGRNGVAVKTAERLLRKYPYLTIDFVAEEWNENGYLWQNNSNHKKAKNSNTGHLVNTNKDSGSSTLDILFVAYGVPKQEEWIYNNISKLPVKAAIGVGGAFDFLSGSVRRAPLILRAIGLEWLYRLFLQPWRWKRQVALFEFIKLVVKEKYNE